MWILAGEVTGVEKMCTMPFLELFPWGFTTILRVRTCYCHLTQQEAKAERERERDRQTGRSDFKAGIMRT